MGPSSTQLLPETVACASSGFRVVAACLGHALSQSDRGGICLPTWQPPLPPRPRMAKEHDVSNWGTTIYSEKPSQASPRGYYGPSLRQFTCHCRLRKRSHGSWPTRRQPDDKHGVARLADASAVFKPASTFKTSLGVHFTLVTRYGKVYGSIAD